MVARNSKTKKLSVGQKLSLTAGSVLALTSASASADIVYIEGNPVSASAFDGQGSTFDWDVDGVGGADFQMWVRSSTFSFGNYFSSNSFYYSFNFYGIVNFASQGYFGTNLNGRGLVGPGGAGVNALEPGFVVGPALNNYQWGATDVLYRSAVRADSFSFVSQSGSSFFNNSAIGIDFANFEEGANFLGFRFDSNGELHYGWAEVVLDGAQITISRWAYESDPNTPINIAEVPEPSLGTLALGAAGILAMRRRRQNLQ